MKTKFLLFLFTGMILIGVSLNAQDIFKPMPKSLFAEQAKAKGVEGAYSAWAWRFDASVAIAELNYNKETKQLVSNALSAVGPAIGIQHYVPTSATDPTPFNNYGVSAALLFGTNIYEPDLAKFKVAVVANIMQYLKFGVTITPKPGENYSPIGLFFGGGVTF